MIKRIVDTSFWTDAKVENFSPKEKYFMLYILTNPFTTQLGIYELSVKQAAHQLGLTTDDVINLLEKFESEYEIIKYSYATNEIAIKNYLRHSIVKGGAHVFDLLVKEIKKVKNKDLIAWVFLHLGNFENLNKTVNDVVDKYKRLNGNITYFKYNYNGNDNVNVNDNDVSYHDTVTNRSVANNHQNNQSGQKFFPPTLEEVKKFIMQEALNVDAYKFFNYYTANGWMIGKTKMRDWKAAIRSWANNMFNQGYNEPLSITDEDRIAKAKGNIPVIDDE